MTPPSGTPSGKYARAQVTGMANTPVLLSCMYSDMFHTDIVTMARDLAKVAGSQALDGVPMHSTALRFRAQARGLTLGAE